MKKVILIFTLFVICLVKYDAECTYKDLKELNTFSSFIETSYKYNETTGYFDLTITNLEEKAYISTKDGGFYYPSNGEVVVSNLKLGSSYKFNVYPTASSECAGELLRVLYVNIPYKNYYYGSLACEGHEDLKVCNQEFLDYELSENTFFSLLNKKNEEVKEEEKPKEEEQSFTDKLIEYLSSIYIKVILVIVTSIITISIFEIILRKVKHGF